MHSSRRDFMRMAGLAGASLIASQSGCSSPGPAREEVAELIPRQENPFNAEPRLDRLVEDWITPTRSFYVRSHGTRPAVDPGTYRLSIEGLVDRPRTFTLEDLEGKKVTLSDYRGRVVLVMLWTTW